MKRASSGITLLTPNAARRLADARAALQRARAGQDKALSRQRAGEAEVKRLESLAEEIPRALKAAKERLGADRTHAAAWKAVLGFAEADIPVAEKEFGLAEARNQAARFRREHGDGSDARALAALEEAVGRAENALETARTSGDRKTLAADAAKAERQLEAIRKAESDRNRAALIDRKLAQLGAASAKKAQERKTWNEREQSLGEELAKLEAERKRLVSEREQLSGKA